MDSQDGNKPHLDVTLHPDVPLARLPVPLIRNELVDGEIRYADDERRLPELLLPPKDVLYREMKELDLADPDVVMAFLDRFGAVDPRPFPGMKLLPPRHYPPTPSEDGLHWSHTAMWLRAARAMANHWDLLVNGEDPTDAWEQEGFSLVWTDYLADQRFEEMLNIGLRHPAYSPRARLTRTTPPWDDITQELWGNGLLPDLYAALCAEVWNLVAYGLIPHDCANDNCSNRFTEKRGATGAANKREIYCEQACTSSQTSRESRRKKAARAAQLKIPQSRTHPEETT